MKRGYNTPDVVVSILIWFNTSGRRQRIGLFFQFLEVIFDRVLI